MFVSAMTSRHKHTGYWPFNWQICNLWVTCDVFTCSSSILHMCFISVGRLIGIRNPLHARHAQFVSRRTVFLKISIAWAFSAIIASTLTSIAWADTRNIVPETNVCAINNSYFLFFGEFQSNSITVTRHISNYLHCTLGVSQCVYVCLNDGSFN